MNAGYSTTPLGERLADNSTPVKLEQINWKTVEKNVNKLQARIVKAVRQNKWHLVKRLQYLLTNSFHAKLLAVKKVTQNRGKRTAGIDGEKWTTSNSKMKAAQKLSDKKYKAQPLRRIYIEKQGKKKKRPLSIPTMYDRAMQALYALALNPIAETTADRMSYGFRKYRSSQNAQAQLFTCLSKRHFAQWILEGDIICLRLRYELLQTCYFYCNFRQLQNWRSICSSNTSIQFRVNKILNRIQMKLYYIQFFLGARKDCVAFTGLPE